jgi:hypothetical protein
MHDEVQAFKRFCRELSEHRRICTGEELDLAVIETWPSQVHSLAEFGALVSKAHILWRENWGLDVAFLLGLRRADGVARDFGFLIYHLRTAKEHDDNPDAVARWDTWTMDVCGGTAPATENNWAACGRELMVQLNAAIECLCKLAAACRRDASLRQAWLAKAGESVAAMVNSVADDLGMSLNPGQLSYHVRDVERLWKRYRPRRGEVPGKMLASLAERSLVSNMDALPCDHQQVLDELGVLGTADAIAVLHLAHAVAEISGTSGETYLKLVESTWTALRPDATRNLHRSLSDRVASGMTL